MSEMYSVQIDNYPYAFASVFERIDAYVGWKMMMRSDYAESREIYIVFDIDEEEILISDKPYGEYISNLDEFLNSFFDNADDDEEESEDDEENEDVTFESTFESIKKEYESLVQRGDTTNKIKLNSIKEMENKEMLKANEIMNVATIINTVNMMLNTGKVARINVTDDATYITISNAEGFDETTINANLFDTKEELLRVALFGESKLERIVEKETERPVVWESLDYSSTMMKDWLLEIDDENGNHEYANKMREEFGDEWCEYMELPEPEPTYNVIEVEFTRVKKEYFRGKLVVPSDREDDWEEIFEDAVEDGNNLNEFYLEERYSPDYSIEDATDGCCVQTNVTKDNICSDDTFLNDVSDVE